MKIGKYSINERYTVSHIANTRVKNKKTGKIEHKEIVVVDASNSWLSWSLKDIVRIGNKAEAKIANEMIYELSLISDKYKVGFLDKRSEDYRIEEIFFYNKKTNNKEER